MSLSNNRQLKTIPDCIGNLPNILFLNAKGSTNLNMPESILSRSSSDMGTGMWDLSGDI
jgi:hypothetical protein